MKLARIGNAIVNIDNAEYIAAKKRKENNKRNLKIEILEERINHIEKSLLELQNEINMIITAIEEEKKYKETI